jgi:aminoglycoside phosphotransferase (APT) family kinase protein
MFEANKRAQIQKLWPQLNDEALCKVASSLNAGKKCFMDHSAVDVGGANYHVHIRFEDKSPSWLVRIPRGGWPPVLEEYLVLSEYATLKFLERTNIPSPKAFGNGIRGKKGNDMGVSYLLIEKMPGKVWHEGSAPGSIPTQELEKVMTDLANILIELHRHPFDKIGSLQFKSSKLEVSAVASDQTLVLGPSGPFKSSRSYYTAYAEQYLALIGNGKTYTNFPVEAYLIYSYLKEKVDQLCPTTASEHFFLKHIDDKGDHLMVDENMNIVGVIDWQMARIAPAVEAFGPSLVTADMNALCQGKYGLTSKDKLLASILRKKGAVDLANSMSAHEKARRFMWGLGAETDWQYARPLANAIFEAFGGGKMVNWGEWKEKELTIRQGDVRLQRLIARLQDGQR